MGEVKIKIHNTNEKDEEIIREYMKSWRKNHGYSIENKQGKNCYYTDGYETYIPKTPYKEVTITETIKDLTQRVKALEGATYKIDLPQIHDASYIKCALNISGAEIARIVEKSFAADMNRYR